MFNKKMLMSLIVLVVFLLLAACSMDVSKEDESNNNEEEEDTTIVTEDLPDERKVRDLELYVTTPDYDPVRYELGLMVADEWRNLGFDVKVTPLAWSRLSELGMQQKDFDAFTLAWSGRAERIDPDHFVYLTLHSTNAGFGAYNIVGYDNPEYDDIADRQRTVTDVNERKKLTDRAQEIFLEDLPYAPIMHRNQLMAYNKTNFSNLTVMMGEGVNSFWSFMDVTPNGDRKVLRWGYPSDVTSLNPLSSTNSHDFQTTRLIYDRLIRILPSGEPENWAAESITDVNGDGMTYEIKIRPNMNFHDGVPVTAEDVKFSFDLVKEIESPFYMGMVKSIESVDVTDELTVQFNLSESFAPFISNTLAQMYIFPKHVWDPILQEKGASGVLEHQNIDIIGSGPFKMDYWRRDQEMMLQRNDDHFQQPHIEGILKIPYANVQGMVGAIGQGEVDTVGWYIEPLQADKLKSNEDIELIDIPDHGLYHINYNMRRMPFDDKAVRLAMSYVIPKDRIVNEILEGYGEVANSFIGPMNEFWHNSDIEPFKYDLGKARQLLEDAGYEWDADGKIYYPKGKSDADKDRGTIIEIK